MDEKTIITDSPLKTQKLGEDIAHKLHGGECILLYGDLGSGKTTLAQGIAKGLGVEGRVTSPTFTIVKRYMIDKHSPVKTLYHIDAYRLQNEEDAKGIGIQEFLADPHGVVVCEWPERLGQLLPQRNISIRCAFVDEEKRMISTQ